jgi:hypothetical protein
LILACVGTAHAEGTPKVAKPVVCLDYTIASTSDGGSIGVCAPSKPGGKPRYLRSFVESHVLDPSTGKPQAMLVGFQ